MVGVDGKTGVTGYMVWGTGLCIFSVSPWIVAMLHFPWDISKILPLFVLLCTIILGKYSCRHLCKKFRQVKSLKYCVRTVMEDQAISGHKVH